MPAPVRDGSGLCAHLLTLIVLRLFACFNAYKDKQRVRVLLFKAIQLLKHYPVDIAEVTHSLILESMAKNSTKRKTFKSLLKVNLQAGLKAVKQDSRQVNLKAVWDALDEKYSLKLPLAVYLGYSD